MLRWIINRVPGLKASHKKSCYVLEQQGMFVYLTDKPMNNTMNQGIHLPVLLSILVIALFTVVLIFFCVRCRRNLRCRNEALGDVEKDNLLAGKYVIYKFRVV